MNLGAIPESVVPTVDSREQLVMLHQFGRGHVVSRVSGPRRTVCRPAVQLVLQRSAKRRTGAPSGSKDLLPQIGLI